MDRLFHTKGQVNPLKLGQLISGRVVDNQDRRLVAIRIYRGIPDARKSPQGDAAYLRQRAVWEKLSDLITVIGRPLRYPHNFPEEQPREKGY